MKRLFLCGLAVVLFSGAIAPKHVGACPITPCDPVKCRNSCGPLREAHAPWAFATRANAPCKGIPKE